MIAAVRGRITASTPGRVCIETQSGFSVGVLVPVSGFSALQPGKEILLYTVLKIKDEDIVLYGFLDPGERRLFEKLIGVSGVGGKIAMSCISAFSDSEMAAAIEGGDVDKISSIPGIGKKTAQRIVLELTGKLEREKEAVDERVRLKEDIVSGLVNLGYPAKQVKEAANRAFKEHPETVSFEEMFKLLLRKINR